MMAHLEAGKTRKGKNFSAEEERSLCRSFLAVSQDPVCGNGQRNSAFWERITTHFNQNKPRANPMRPARSLETKWGHIKHDVGKFCGAYKQVYDCRVSGTSLEDVPEKVLEYYQDRHPKLQSFVYLHCWQLLKEVPRWWDSPFDVQKRTSTQEGLQKFGSMPKRKSPPSSASTSAAEAGTGTDGNDAANASDEEVEEIVEQAFPRCPSRPQGSKAAKRELAAHAKREKIMQKQVLASERMAEASLLKATAMQDQCALSLFTMPTGEGLTEQARRYIELRRMEEIERLERRILSEHRAVELAKLEHERLLKERSYDGPRSRHGRGAAAATSPVVTVAPPCVLEVAIANADAGTFFSSRRNVNFSFCFLISYKLASNPQWRPQWMLLVVMRFPAMVDL